MRKADIKVGQDYGYFGGYGHPAVTDASDSRLRRVRVLAATTIEPRRYYSGVTRPAWRVANVLAGGALGESFVTDSRRIVRPWSEVEPAITRAKARMGTYRAQQAEATAEWQARRDPVVAIFEALGHEAHDGWVNTRNPNLVRIDRDRTYPPKVELTWDVFEALVRQAGATVPSLVDGPGRVADSYGRGSW